MKCNLFFLAIFAASVLVPRFATAEILIHAAASLTDALQEIAGMYQQEYKQKLEFNFGASSTLARQIQEGAPGDIIFSADEEKMDALQKNSLLLSQTRKSILSNTLAIVVPGDSKTALSSIHDLLNIRGRIAIAEPGSVPAGIYAKQYLQKAGLWNKIFDRLIPADNVRAALAIVESGNAEAGIVYKTDAAISKGVRVALEIPRTEGPEIRYVIAVLKEARDPEASLKFYQYLITDRAIEVYQKYGFLPADGNNR